MLVGYRQRDCDLTIVLLAKLAAILPGDTDRMNALLGETCVVDDPGAYPAAPLDAGENKGSNLPQQVLLRPVGVGDKMVQRLMRALNPAGSTRAAIGSTLLRSPGRMSPVQYERNGVRRSACPRSAAMRST